MQTTHDTKLKWDTEAAIEFLQHYNPDGPWHLSAITLDKRVNTRTFTAQSIAQMRNWIDDRQNVDNLYFHVNALTVGLVDKRAKKDDIAKVPALHVDIDVAPGDNRDEALPKMLDQLHAFDKPPTVINFSGGGYQAFWALHTPVPINERPADVESIESYNRGLEHAFDGDHCFNIDRLMRLPGTVNLPDERKQKLGRVPTVAYVVEADWNRRYDITQFERVAADAPSSPRTSRSKPGKAQTAERGSFRSGAAYREAFRLHTSDQIHSYDEMVDALLKADDPGIIEWVHEKGVKRGEYELHNIWDKINNVLLLSAASPYASAQQFLSDRYGENKLLRYAQTFYEWVGTHYVEREDDAIAAELYEYLEMAWQPVGNNKPAIPFNPTQHKVNQIINALEALTYNLNYKSAVEFTPPCWLDGRNEGVILACRNGLLRLDDETLLPHTPAYFNTSALDFDYDPDPPNPEVWYKFLESVWPNHAEEGSDDLDCIRAVQEQMGYIISGDRSRQKIFLHQGPSRAGKGVLSRVLTKLLGGAARTAGLRLSNFGKNEFGLQPLIGKLLAVIPDARNRSSDQIVETLLAISGGDPLTINRKHKDAVTLILATQLLMLSNTVPKLVDSSGVIASRFVVVPYRNSFLNREDFDLEDKLAKELPGILRFAIDGWRALQKQGRFTQPKSGLAIHRALMRGASEIIAFIQDNYILDPEEQELTEGVYQRYCVWFADTHQPGKLVSTRTFGRELVEAFPQISRVRLRVKGEYGDDRPYFYVGLRHNPNPEDVDE